MRTGIPAAVRTAPGTERATAGGRRPSTSASTTCWTPPASERGRPAGGSLFIPSSSPPPPHSSLFLERGAVLLTRAAFRPRRHASSRRKHGFVLPLESVFPGFPAERPLLPPGLPPARANPSSPTAECIDSPLSSFSGFSSLSGFPSGKAAGEGRGGLLLPTDRPFERDVFLFLSPRLDSLPLRCRPCVRRCTALSMPLRW